MNNFLKAGALAALVFASVAANATAITSNYTVNASETDPGLRISTADAADNPFTFGLVAGGSTTFDLFDIWTDEGSVNGDDRQARPISVDFAFLSPQTGSSTTTGETDGFRRFFGAVQAGVLSWNEPADFVFGPNNDGRIQVSLSNERFNRGFFGLDSGRGDGATVSATLSLIADASPADVPEPAMLGLFTLALLGMGFAASRRRIDNRG